MHMHTVHGMHVAALAVVTKKISLTAITPYCRGILLPAPYTHLCTQRMCAAPSGCHGDREIDDENSIIV
jgi:hypothetical protein